MRRLIQTLLFLAIIFFGPNIYAQNTPWSTTGNIGIGTTTASNKLSVVTSTYNDGLLVGFNGPSGGNLTGWTLLNGPSFQSGSFNGLTLPGDAGLIYGQSGGPLSFGFVIAPWMNGYTGIRLDKNGNVGIAVSDTKGYQLAVNGSAIFNKVVVKQYPNWPDYVFDSTYRLLPLKELHRYVKDNHHLPDIPSADSIASIGVDIGANQTALLRKIEELTLYAIAQDEELKKARQDRDDATAEIKKLQDRIDKIEILLNKNSKHE